MYDMVTIYIINQSVNLYNLCKSIYVRFHSRPASCNISKYCRFLVPEMYHMLPVSTQPIGL